jgi:hypothetical protein
VAQVDWIEVPPLDAIPLLKHAGLQIRLWPYPHTYPNVLNCMKGSPIEIAVPFRGAALVLAVMPMSLSGYDRWGASGVGSTGRSLEPLY